MTHDEALFEALAYRRYVGGTVGDLRAAARWRIPKQRPQRDDSAALRRLQERGIVFAVARRWYLTARGFKQAKGSALKPEWQPTDAWILLPVVHARTTPLEGILGAMDWINREWPSLEALHEGVNRLVSGHLIKVRANSFTATRQGLKLYAKVQKAHPQRVRDQQEALWQIMNCPCCGVGLKRVRWKIHIDDPVYHPALASAYLAFRSK